jgi:hypothetical protein
MKLLCTLLILALACSLSTIVVGQNTKYVESNFGVSIVNSPAGAEALAPGSSYLWGSRNYINQNIFIDKQLGLAFPSLVTAKIGMGKMNLENGESISGGIRIFPTHLYIQRGWGTKRSSFLIRKRSLRKGKTIEDVCSGEWTLSFEVSPFILSPEQTYMDDPLSVAHFTFFSYALITVGHKWFLQ